MIEKLLRDKIFSLKKLFFLDSKKISFENVGKIDPCLIIKSPHANWETNWNKLWKKYFEVPHNYQISWRSQKINSFLLESKKQVTKTSRDQTELLMHTKIQKKFILERDKDEENLFWKFYLSKAFTSNLTIFVIFVWALNLKEKYKSSAVSFLLVES